MVYSEMLAERIRQLLSRRKCVAEKRMFGGICFLLDGNICVGVWNNSLVARIGEENAAEALRRPGVGEFDVTGRPMKGWVLVDPSGIGDDDRLNGWIDDAVQFVAQLPAK